jgi:hypothetical protein
MIQARRGEAGLGKDQDASAPAARRVFEFHRLFQVAIRHEYCRRPQVNGPFSFHAAPTRATEARMQALGMVFRNERDGFSVLYDAAQPWQARQPAETEAARLSFEVFTANPRFVSLTNLDLRTSPRATPLYFTNRVPDAPARASRHDTRGGADGVAVRLRGEVSPSTAPPARLVQISRDFRRIPIAAVDIFVGGASPGACPMPRDGRPGPPVQYEVWFEARRTYWRYHVVPLPGSGPLENLVIDPATFLGPIAETLVNGARAYRFISKVPIALANDSTVRWSLQGRRRERMTRDGVLVDRLPVPAADQLALLTGDERESLGVAEGVCSEMFVYV